MERERKVETVKESVRKCSHCGNNGHNSRTCNGKKGYLKLFGVNIVTDKQDEAIKKSFSTRNLQSFNNAEQHSAYAGYLSNGKAAHETKKGVAWTEEEHLTFLVGLEKVGKGDWKGIAKNFVLTRTPTQVASHAQKYFLRLQAASDKKKRRSSLFDMPFKDPAAPPPQVSLVSPLNDDVEIQTEASSTSPILPLKQTAEIPGQTQVANPFLLSPRMEHPPVLHVAPTPGIRGIPYMMGVPGNGQSFPAAKAIPTVSFIPVMNYPRPGYVYLHKSNGNFATCAPVTFHSSSIPATQSLPQSPSQAGPPATSSTDKDSLELKIGPPQNPQGAELSSQTPGAIRVI